MRLGIKLHLYETTKIKKLGIAAGYYTCVLSLSVAGLLNVAAVRFVYAQDRSANPDTARTELKPIIVRGAKILTPMLLQAQAPQADLRFR